MTVELFPELVQQGVDPARFNAALKAGTIFGPAVTFGLVRRQLGLPAMAGGIPDDLAFPDLLGPSGGAGGIDARKVKFYADQMAANNVILKELHDNKVRMTVKAANGLAAAKAAGLFTVVTPTRWTATQDFGVADLRLPHLGDPDMPLDPTAAARAGGAFLTLGALERLHAGVAATAA